MERAGKHLEDAGCQQADLVPGKIHRRKQEISFRWDLFSHSLIFVGLTANGSERKTPKMKSTKKKKHKKAVSNDVGNDEEVEGDTANEKKGDAEVVEDSTHSNESENTEDQQVEDTSLNVDSLIQNYKVQSQVVAKTDFLENLLHEEQPQESEEDATSTNVDTGTKSTRFSKNFKRDRQTVEKARHNLVKREKENEDEKIHRAGQLLKKVAPSS